MKVQNKRAHSFNLTLLTILPNIMWRDRTPSHVPTPKGPDNDFSSIKSNKSAHLHTVEEEKSEDLQTDDSDNISTASVTLLQFR